MDVEEEGTHMPAYRESFSPPASSLALIRPACCSIVFVCDSTKAFLYASWYSLMSLNPNLLMSSPTRELLA